MKKTDKEKVVSLLNDMMSFDHNYCKYELDETEYNDFIDEIIKLMQSKVNNVVSDAVIKCDSLWHNKHVHRFGSCCVCNGRKKNYSFL